MTDKLQTPNEFLTRRELLHRGGMGMGALALAPLFYDEAVAQQNPQSAIHNPQFENPLTPKQPHFSGKAKRVIHLFMNGGPSHVDTFDPKPQLEKYDGKPLPNDDLPASVLLFSAFGGLAAYGPKGLLLGPIAVRMAREVLEITRDARAARRGPRIVMPDDHSKAP